MRKIIKLGIILLVITAVTGFVLGGVYTATLKPIAEAKQKSLTKTLEETVPNATKFTESNKENSAFTKLYEARDTSGAIVGFNFVTETKGFGGLIELIVGVSHGRVTGVRVLSHSETPGLGARAAETDEGSFINEFTNRLATTFRVVKEASENEADILAISGATITSRAVTNAVNRVVEYYNANLKEEK